MKIDLDTLSILQPQPLQHDAHVGAYAQWQMDEMDRALEAAGY